MEIRPATNQPGMFYLIWNDSGVEGGPRFTKIETVDGKPSQDAILMNGMQHVETLHIQRSAVTPFFDAAADAGVPVCAEFQTQGTEKKPNRQFTGQVTTTPRVGMKAQIKTCYVEGKLHMGNEFTIASVPREICGTWVVALNNQDGSRFSAAYDLSMLEITDLGVAA